MDFIAPKLIDIAREAGEKILEIYSLKDFSSIIDYKSDNSPLTLADKAANAIICGRLNAEFPDIPILSEEGKEISFEERKKWTRFFLVDPLDGTKEFIKRNGEFTVNIALIENGVPVMGVVYAPVPDIMYWNELNGKAFCIKKNSNPVLLTVNEFSLTDSGLGFVVSRSHKSPEVEKYISVFKNSREVDMGSSLKFMVLAEGGADLYPRLGPTMEWDTAAAHAVLVAAGGIVNDFETGLPLRYNKENLLNPSFLASGNILVNRKKVEIEPK